VIDNDDVTVVLSNVSLHSQKLPKRVTSIAEAAREVYDNPMPQYLNFLTIATELAIADTGATSIFVMEGLDFENK